MTWVTDPQYDTLQIGDIVFYQGDRSKPIDALVMRRTNSNLVHVAIVVAENTTIAATSLGITYQNIGTPAHVWRPAAGYATDRLAATLNWLKGQVGQAYGWADVANQVLLLASKDPILLDKSSDCSNLATKFLWIAGIALPPDLIETNRVTPGSLNRALDSVS